MYKDKRFTNEQISEANSINIVALATSRGYDVKKVILRSYKISHYGRLNIKANGSKWNWFSMIKVTVQYNFLWS